MKTELKNQKQEVSKEQWHTGIGWNKPLEYADLVKAAVEYTESKEEEDKKLPVTCINDLVDILSLYVTSGELTPGEFMRCLRLAVEAELKVQQKITDSLTDILDSL